MAKSNEGEGLLTVYVIVGHLAGIAAWIAAFFGAWWYCATEYGFLWGFGFGWVPAFILAGISYVIARFAWPIIGFAILWVIAR